MSFLDLYTGDQQQAMRPAPTEGHDLPASFGESFEAAWNYGRMFAQSTAGENARLGALDDYLKDVREKTGVDLAARMDWSQMNVPGVGPVPMTSSMMLGQARDAAEKLNKDRPPDQAIPTLDDDALERMAVQKSRQAGQTLADVSGREHSGLGLFAGGVASAAADPINLAAIPAAPEAGLGLVAQAIRFGALAAGAQTAIEAASSGFHSEVQPDYLQSGAPFANIAEAFGTGALLGGATRAVGNIWTRVKSGAWPTSIRDAGNVVESEANIADSNPFPQGAAAEVAHRDALVKATDDVIAERPTDVEGIVRPGIAASIDEKIAPLMEERENAAAALRDAAAEQTSGELPFEQTAAAARAQDHLDAMADQISRLARDAGYSMPPTEASQIAERLARGPADQVEAEINGILQQPSTAALPGAKIPEAPERPTPTPPETLRAQLDAPDYHAALQSDIDRERVGDVSRQIPVDVDKDGEPVYRSLDGMADEVEAYRNAADQIASCAAPAPVEGEAS